MSKTYEDLLARGKRLFVDFWQKNIDPTTHPFNFTANKNNDIKGNKIMQKDILDLWLEAEWEPHPYNSDTIRKKVKVSPNLPHGACGDVRDHFIYVELYESSNGYYKYEIKIDIDRFDCHISNYVATKEIAEKMIKQLVIAVVAMQCKGYYGVVDTDITAVLFTPRKSWIDGDDEYQELYNGVMTGITDYDWI